MHCCSHSVRLLFQVRPSVDLSALERRALDELRGQKRPAEEAA
jgi:hypothetical protein